MEVAEREGLIRKMLEYFAKFQCIITDRSKTAPSPWLYYWISDTAQYMWARTDNLSLWNDNCRQCNTWREKIIGDITIGDNVTIGQNCVIVKDIPSDSVVVTDSRQLRYLK